MFVACPPVRAVTFTYNSPNVDWTGDTHTGSVGISSGSGAVSAKLCAQYVLEAFANSVQLSETLPTSNIGQALQYLVDMESTAPTNTNTPSYQGNFAWSLQDTPAYNNAALQVNDQNAAEFVVQALAQVPIRYSAALTSSGYASQVYAILDFALEGINNHSVDPTYTNMAVTHAWNLTALGQVLSANDWAGSPYDASGGAQALLDGQTALSNWIAQVRLNGINEFLSPSYYGVDMDSLGYLYLYANDVGIRSEAQEALKLFWTDLRANWLNQNQHMGGTHSRTYDFLQDTGSTDKYYYPMGLLTSASGRIPEYWRGMDATSYTVPEPSDVAGLFNLSTTNPQEILRSFNNLSANGTNESNALAMQFSTNYTILNPEPFSIASMTTRYNDPTAEGLTVTMPGTPSTININFNSEGRGDPYLQNAIATKTSVTKASTLRPFIASVQHTDDVLFVASTEGKGIKDTTYDPSTTCAESSLIFPVDTGSELWYQDGKSSDIGNDVHASDTQNVTTNIPGTSIVFFRYNGVVTTVRFLFSKKMNGSDVVDGLDTSLNIVNDGLTPPDSSGAQVYYGRRITCVHSSSTPTNNERGSIAMWVHTEYVGTDSNTFANYRSTMERVAVSGTLSSGSAALSMKTSDGTLLSLTADVGDEIFAHDNAQGGQNYQGADALNCTPLLKINNTDYLQSTLQTWMYGDVGGTKTTPTGSTTPTTTGTTTYAVTGGGPDIGGTTDNFQFASQTLTGDGCIIARITGMKSPGQNAKAGVMLRATTDAGSANAYMYLKGNNQIWFTDRTSTGATTTISTGNGSNTNGTAAPSTKFWLKIMRQGTNIYGYTSTDGSTWAQCGATANIPSLGPTVVVGLAVTSGTTSSPVTATFNNVGVFQGVYPPLLPK